MAKQRRLCLPRQGICLVLLMDLWLRVELALVTECSNDEFKVVTKEGITNCLKCSSVTRGLSDPCPDVLKLTCKCNPGYQCSNLPCTTCKPLPQCKSGTELNKSGTDHFKFTCEPCKNGTYSDTLNSCCRPWTNCKSSGLRTIRPGNRTHNVECGIFGAVTPVQQQDSKYTTILAILTALGVFILILMTFFLHLCLWTLKKEKLHIVEEPDHPSILLAPTCRLVEDTYSCQFPEEEHGGKIAEGKLSYCPSVGPH
ncbi:tumor necrosis factor receptor superfamily member 18 [Dermochelys coriacea]|uniref:tumor necrosis factor receptor superfamily member 18 n=1 Tax=Dermochelys coriacea TaxID=27794 RepID=UPI0018E83F34|nr:tumor necrosis factor receptor superfamily member 18 [Dermochelys coriacea]